jgi:hypothetical protein
MSRTTTEVARVVSVAVGVENTDQAAPARDGRHEAPGEFFVVHSAFGKIGDRSVGGVEIIGVDGEAYSSTFYDSFGNVHRSRLEMQGDLLRWTGDRTRCTATLADGGVTQVARHESSADSVSWTASMDVTLRKVA